MKKVILAFMAMVMIGGLSYGQDKDAEKLRKEFATLNVEPILEINQYVNENFENSDKVSFDEFLKHIPEHHKISREGKILIERAFNFAKKDPTQEEIVNTFGIDEMGSIATMFNSDEFKGLTSEQAVKKLLLENPEDDLDVEVMGFWGNVWNAIKKAAIWVWKNSGTILNIVRIFVAIF